MPLRDMIRIASVVLSSMALAGCQSGPAPVASTIVSAAPIPVAVEPPPVTDDVHRVARLEIGPLQPTTPTPVPALAAVPGVKVVSMAAPSAPPERTPCDPTIEQALTMLGPVVTELKAMTQTLDAEHVATLVEQLRCTADRLKPKAALQLKNVHVVQAVTGFGTYEPRAADKPFRPGEALDLYVEVGNFSSESTDEVEHVVRLSSELTLVEDGNRKRQSWSFETTSSARSVRRDYSHTYSVRIPADWPEGHYVLRVLVRDQPTGRSAEASIGLRLAGTAIRKR